jgi:RNA 3'-terminal phosphate cyclase (ATP)
LVLQTLLPALLLAEGPSELILEEGTHNPLAPPFEFLQHAFLPLINRMGPHIQVELVRPGFAPRGGGCLRVRIEPAERLMSLHLPQRGAIKDQYAQAVLDHLPSHIAERELAVLARELDLGESQLRVQRMNQAFGPGNVLNLIVESEHISECFSAFGRRGVPAEQVAGELVGEVREYLRAGVPVGAHLADQLLLPLALAGGGSFKTLPPSPHVRTNIQVIQAFVPCEFVLNQVTATAWQVRVN